MIGRRAFPIAIVLLLAAAPAPAHAHSPGESFLALDPSSGSGSWEIAVRDLDDALGIDDGDGRITAAELRTHTAEIVPYALARLDLDTPAGRCPVSVEGLRLTRRLPGASLALDLRFRCPVGADHLSLGYRLFFDRDRLHHALVRVGAATAVVRAGQPAPPFPLTASTPGRAVVLALTVAGARHIWQGLDHILFLIALLLPAVLRRDASGRWLPVPALRPALVDVARIVTAFTAAHSLTLGLAASGLVRVSGRIIEPAIAASVVLAAANNLRQLFGRDRWAVAFALGLLHGFGFSSALAEMGMAGGGLLWSLLGFNLGVELGQLALVALFVPTAFLLRRFTGYRRFALVGGSLAIATCAAVWLVERALHVSLIG